MRGSRNRTLHDRAVINCQYSMATFSTAERKRRPHGDRKSTEMSLHLKQTFEAAVMTQLYPRSQIDIYVKVEALSHSSSCHVLHRCFKERSYHLLVLTDANMLYTY